MSTKKKLTAYEESQAKELASARAHILHEVVLREGAEEVERPPRALLYSGLACGISMGLSLLGQATIYSALPHGPWNRVVYALGYPLGFLAAIIGRQQLFTENTLTPVVPVLEHPSGENLRKMLRLWGLILASNWVGAMAIGYALSFPGLLAPELREAMAAISREAVGGSFGTNFFRAIFGGWIIALLTWMLGGMKSSGVKVIFLLTYVLAASGFTHVIAGTVECAAALSTGGMTWKACLLDFFVPVLLGNVVGGVFLVAILNHAQART